MSKNENEINSLFIARSGSRSRLMGREMPMDKEIKLPRKPKEPKQPARPGTAAENIDKWANSPGLQPPK